ncbi:MAG: OmpA family protein [bacterium]
MKKRFLTLMIAGVLATQAGWADQSTHVGSQVLEKGQIIDMLQPKMKTRGIRINQPAQAAATGEQVTQDQAQQVAAVEQQAPAAPPPSISMEINFAYNSAELTDHSLQQLAPLGQALQSPELAGLAFMLEGHTDATGTEDYNMVLSQRRAQAVGQFLYEYYGVDPNNLNLIGRGETALLDQTNPTSGVNRRVTITTLTN